MSESLRGKIGLIPEAGWRPYREDTEVICECAELRVRVGRLLEQLREWAEAWVLLPSTG